MQQAKKGQQSSQQTWGNGNTCGSPRLLQSFRSCDLAQGPRLSGDFAKKEIRAVPFGSSFFRRPVPMTPFEACDASAPWPSDLLREIHGLSRWCQDWGIDGLSEEHLEELRRLRQSS